jgi:hypothetical protein
MFKRAIKRARTEVDPRDILQNSVAYKLADEYFFQCQNLTSSLEKAKNDTDKMVIATRLENALNHLEEYATVVVGLPEFRATVTYIDGLDDSFRPKSFYIWLIAFNKPLYDDSDDEDEDEDEKIQ